MAQAGLSRISDKLMRPERRALEAASAELIGVSERSALHAAAPNRLRD